jgi:hypothetical protein
VTSFKSLWLSWSEQPSVYSLETLWVSWSEPLSATSLESCPYKASNHRAIRCHFWNKHYRDTVIIEEEEILPQCSLGGLFQFSVGPSHQAAEDCKRHARKQQKQLRAPTNKWAMQEVNFNVNGERIKTIRQFNTWDEF